MICLLHSIRNRTKKGKSPRSVGASGVKCFFFNDFEQKLLQKKLPLLNSLKKIRKTFALMISLKKLEKNFHCWIYWKKFEKNFHCWFHWKKIEKIFHCWFHWKKNWKNFPLMISLKKNRKKFPLLISLKNKFVTFYRIFQEVKKKCQILSKFVSSNLPHPYKIFRIMVGETLKKLSKSYRI